ncbi:MAG: SPOR domain-containing protein [Oricola sp.]|nr:MAG: SPOR domain-containing protein [Oricola sp.]
MADTADRKPFRSDDDLPADGPGGIDPLLELSQIAGFEPDGGAQPEARQIDLEDALLAELTPQEAPAEPVDLPPFIGGGPDIDATTSADDPSAPVMEPELSPPLADPTPAMDIWPPSPSEAEAPPPASDAFDEVPAFLSTPGPAPDAAPAAHTLEDELAAMLAGDRAAEPATDVPPANTGPAMAAPPAADPAPPSDDAGLAPVAEESATHDMDPAPVEMSAGTASMMPDAELGAEPVDPAPKDRGPFDASPLDAAPAGDVLADPAETPVPMWDEPSAPELQAADRSEIGPEPDMGVEAPRAPSLDEDFAAAFDEELSAADGTDANEDPFVSLDLSDAAPADDQPADAEPLDPVDELAAIMGYEPPATDAEAEASAASEPDVARTLDAMDADFEAALDADLSGALSLDDDAASVPPAAMAAANADPAPMLDMVDMSPFEAVPASDFEVPEFDGGDARPAEAPDGVGAAFEDAFDREPYATPQPVGLAQGNADQAPAAAMAAAFDSEQFEAELARDMEFVGHDLNAQRGADGLDLDAVEDNATPAPAPAPAERSGRRGMVIGLVVAGLAVAGVAGVLALSGGDGAVDDGPVLVEADDAPVKIEPDDPGGTTVPNQDRAVFADGDTAEPSQQNLVSTAEEPVDIATAPADSLPAAVAIGEKAEDRLTEGGTEASSSDAVAPITPRRVRTLIVRPDGTLEERAPAPVETGAAQPGATETPVASAPAATQPAAPQTAPVVEAPQTVAGVPVTDAAEPAAPVANDPVADAASSTSAAPASQAAAEAASEAAPVVVRRVQTTTATPPLIRDRPSDQPVNVVNRQQVAAAPAAAPAPAPQAAAAAQQAAVPVTTTSGSTGFSVQLAALPSEESARATATRLSQQYGGLIAGRGLTIQRAVIEGRGTFYRVRVAANGSGDANALCNSIKASGGNCFVAR